MLEHVCRLAEWLAIVRAMLEPGGVPHLQEPSQGSLSRRLTGPPGPR